MQFMFRRLYERHKIFCWTAIGLVLLYTVTGFVAVPLIIDHTLRNKVSQLLHRKVRVDSVRTNPYTFSIRLKGLSVSNGERERLLHVGNLYANADPLVSLFKWGVVIKSVEIDRPEVHISRFSDGRFNFKDMISSPNKDTRPTQAKPAQPLRWVLQHLEMTDGVFHYKDEGQPQPFESTLSALDVRIDRLDTQPEAKAAEFRIAARSEADESVEITGGVDVDPLDVSAKIRLKGLLIGKYAPYYRSHLNGKVTDGRLGIQAIISWSDKARAIDKIGLKISGFALVSSQENRLLAVPQFRVTGAAIDLNRRTVQLGRVTTRNGQIDVAFDRQGQLNFMQVLAPPSSPDETAAPSRDAAARAQTPMWTVNVPTLVVDNYTVRYRDQQTDPVADMTAHRIHIDAKTLSNQKDAKGTVAVNLNWADQGTLSLEGMVGLVPLQADMTLDARELDVRPLQPYINQHLQLLVTKGLLGSEGRLKLMTRPADGLDIQYAGQVAMNQFKSVDKVKAADFLDWKSLYLKGVAFDSKPFKLMVDEVALTDFYSLFIINADGSSNLAIVTGGDGKAATQKNGGSKISSKAEKPKAESGESNIKIKTVTLQGGKVDFSDLSVKPHVRLPMSQIGGRISGLDTIRTHKADVLLKGMVGEKVPMEIKGAINPLIKDPFVDITIALNGVDLSPFTPYSGKYLGYKLEKGQLSLDLAYRVVDNKLAGKNKVLFKQLTLGETVQSPTATKLPIKLALALLKDRKGNIDLNLPVTGDLDDPEFSIGGIVIKMFVNLIVDVVSSPFKVLGGLFGGGEELAYLDFDPGQSRIPEANLNKLDTLAKILYERPGLNLEIQGEISPTEDIEGLRRLRFDAQLKAAKLKKMAARGKKAVPLEQIDLSPEERVKLVKKAYDAAKFPKPRDEKGALKKIGPEEMEKLLYTAIEITDDDLRLLAHQRAAAAKSYLAEHGKVEAGRLFIVEPKIDGGEAEQRSRVKFNFT
jgi:hypothetical protein